MGNPKVKRCRCCNQVKAFADFYRNFAGSRGEGAECKQCVNRRAELRKQIEAENAGTSRATPRTFVKPGAYSQAAEEAKQYVRNSGNKHIPSRGFQ